MYTPRSTALFGRLSRSLASGMFLLFAGTTASSLAAQQVQAFYPLIQDLLDATNTYGPISLLGTTPPAPPNNGVCVNGVYQLSTGGQDVRTPILSSLDTTDFQIEVEFNINAMPATNGPVLIGGNGWRWLGIYLQPNGTVGIKHNNSNLAWSTTTLSTGVWYAANLKYELGTVQLLINGAIVLQASVGPLNDGNNKNLTTNDYSVGKNFNGCIKNLIVSNDTTTGTAQASAFGAGCAGSNGVPTLTPSNTPQLSTTFTIAATNLAANAPFAFMTLGFSSTTSLIGPLPFNLAGFGLGSTCELLVSTDATVLFGTAVGSGTFGFAVPSATAFAGLGLYFQCASIDTGATGGIAVSNGVNAVLGF